MQRRWHGVWLAYFVLCVATLFFQSATLEAPAGRSSRWVLVLASLSVAGSLSLQRIVVRSTRPHRDRVLLLWGSWLLALAVATCALAAQAMGHSHFSVTLLVATAALLATAPPKILGI